MTRIILCAATAVLATGGAAADCPATMADAAAGIYVDFGDQVVRFDRRPDGRVEELEYDTEDAAGYRYISQHGILVLESWEMTRGFVTPGTYEVITYEAPIPAVLSPGLSYATNTRVQYGSDAPFDEPLSINVGPQQSTMIGGCSFATMPVEMLTGPAGSQDLSTFTYLPALGFGIFTGASEAAAPEAPSTILSISTDPPEMRGGGAVASPDPAPAPPSPDPAPSK